MLGFHAEVKSMVTAILTSLKAGVSCQQSDGVRGCIAAAVKLQARILQWAVQTARSECGNEGMGINWMMTDKAWTEKVTPMLQSFNELFTTFYAEHPQDHWLKVRLEQNIACTHPYSSSEH